MRGKPGLLGFFILFVIALLVFPYFGHSAEYQTGSTTMNVTIRGYVSISVSTCLTNGITFATQDPDTSDNNGTCNWGVGLNGGTGYNITVDQSSTVNINFTHATNRTNMTDGTNFLDIGNVTYNSNSTEDNSTLLITPGDSEAMSMSWVEMETCGTLSDGVSCWSTYFLDVPITQPPGTYKIGYCWCGRQQGTGEGNCGTCT